MTTEEAFAIIDKILSEFKGNRADHAMLIQAMQIVRNLVPKTEEPKEKST